MKTVLMSDELHKRAKETSKKTGISIKSLVETALTYYLGRIKIIVEEDR
jgi:hypothetical protein